MSWPPQYWPNDKNFVHTRPGSIRTVTNITSSVDIFVRLVRCVKVSFLKTRRNLRNRAGPGVTGQRRSHQTGASQYDNIIQFIIIKWLNISLTVSFSTETLLRIVSLKKKSIIFFFKFNSPIPIFLSKERIIPHGVK